MGPPWIGLDTARQSPEVLCPCLNRSEPRLMQEIPWIHDPRWGLPTKGYPRTLTHSEASLDRTCSDLLRHGHSTSGGYPVGFFESCECEVGLVRSEDRGYLWDTGEFHGCSIRLGSEEFDSLSHCSTSTEYIAVRRGALFCWGGQCHDGVYLVSNGVWVGGGCRVAST